MQNRQVLVTGAGGALGLEVTNAALASGAEVTALVLGKDAATLAGRLGRPAFAKLRLVPCDVTELAQVEHAVRGMERVDVLLHLVGGFLTGPTHEVSAEDFERVVRLNLTSSFCAVRAVLPGMLRAGYGRIVTVASRSAQEPSPEAAVYAACKAAVLAFTRSVAEETRGCDITANTVLPSIIDTPANREAMGADDANLWVSPRSLARMVIDLGRESARDLRGTAVRAYGRV
ncbi:MAG: SDR family NAD(P)-dependent oxidoreductase [Nannocystales bacterium]